jgi:ribosomal-protein-alanine N-acetyltransferase
MLLTKKIRGQFMEKTYTEADILGSIRKINHAIAKRSKLAVSKSGVTLPQLSVMQELLRKGPMTASELSNSVSISISTLTGVVSRLEAKKMVKKNQSKRDRRSVVISITKKGEEKLDGLPPSGLEDALESLGSWDKEIFGPMVAKLALALETDGLAKSEDDGPMLVGTFDGDCGKVEIYRVDSLGSLEFFTTADGLARFIMDALHPYEDTFEDTLRGIDDAIGGDPRKGGFIVLAIQNKKLLGAVVMLETRMQGYIPDKCLLFVGVDQNNRSHGIGRKLIETAVKESRGDIYLHVEYANKGAQRLYERIGFVNRYAEMRYYRYSK